MMFSMYICLRSMLRMLIMCLTSLYCRWKQMENYSQSLSIYCRKRCSCSRTEQLSKLRCSGNTSGLMKLHGRWRIRCGLCILPCLLVKAKQFWYDVLGMCLGICFGDVTICTYVYGCKYYHEISYKAPISSMGVMLL